MTKSHVDDPSSRSNAWLRRQWALRPERNVQIAIAVVVGLLLAAPVVSVMIGAFRTSPFQNGEWSLEPIAHVMTSARTWSTLWNTVLLTVASVVPAIFIAIFFATLTTRTNARLKWFITAIMAVMVAVPPLFYGLTWSMLGNETVGLLNVWFRGLSTGFAEGYQWGEGPINMASMGGLIFVSIFRNVAFMYIILIGPFASMDRTLEEAARVSGAGAVRTFLGTQIPMLMPAIAAVLILSTILSLEAFDIPVILGIPAGIYVLPTEVYRYINGSPPQYGEASAVSIILLVILIALIIVDRRLRGRRSFTTVSGKGARSGLWDLGKWRIPVAILTLLYGIVAVLLPFAQLVIVSISPYFGATSGWTLDNFATVLGSPDQINIFLRTVGVAALAATITVIVATIVLWAGKLRRGLWGEVLGVVTLLPMVLPGLLLAIGLITVVLLTSARGLLGSSLLLIIALFIASVPLAGRSVAGAIEQIPAELEEATRVSGGSRGRALIGVVFRLLAPSLLNGWLLCFVVTSGILAIPMLLGVRSEPMMAISVYDDFLAGNFTLAGTKFVIFVAEILIIAAVIEVIKWTLTRKQNTKRNTAIVSASDPDWTGAVATRRARKISRFSK